MASTLANAASSHERAVAQTATSSRALFVARLGFAARGAVYLIVGWLAVLAAAGHGGSVTDNHGALEAIAQQPQGAIPLGLVAVGLAAYAAWSLVRAIFDPERRGHDAHGVAVRVGCAFAGVSYGGLALAAANLARGAGSAGQNSDASTQDWTARLLDAPFGPPLVIAAGLIFFVIAISEFVAAYTAGFRKNLTLEGLSADLQRWIVRVGRTGLAARGVVFALIGVFLIQASRHQDAQEAVGLGGALQKLAEQPYGPYWLGVVAVGLAMYGVFSFVEARYRRLRR
jgi:uncharacterized protein DUF1206